MTSSSPTPSNSPSPDRPYVSRGGPKLAHALERFKVNPAGLRCADLGCSTGGFTDCLLRAGAAQVTAVDTGYGVLAWTLRNDPRVRVLERTNALHAGPSNEGERVDLVVMDLSWTRQRLAIPAAKRWARPDGRLITLIKPHYENQAAARQHRGLLPDAEAERIAREVLASLPELGVRVLAEGVSPVRGSAGKREGQGNIEWLALLAPGAE